MKRLPVTVTVDADDPRPEDVAKYLAEIAARLDERPGPMRVEFDAPPGLELDIEEDGRMAVRMPGRRTCRFGLRRRWVADHPLPFKLGPRIGGILRLRRKAVLYIDPVDANRFRVSDRRMTASRSALSILASLLAAGAACWFLSGRVGRPAEGGRNDRVRHDPSPAAEETVPSGRAVAAERPAVAAPVDGGASGRDGSDIEALVDAFDALTDKWREPSDGRISIEDTQRFAEQFRRLPAARKEECLHRALNLVPDENIVLLAGILIDKTQGADFLQMIFDDVMNRSEAVKMPILRQICKDRSHPCRSAAAWVLETTGELRKNGNGDAGK